MAEPKTQKNAGDVRRSSTAIEDPARQADARAIDALLTQVTKAAPVMYGERSWATASTCSPTQAVSRGRGWFSRFAPRKTNTTVYLNGKAEEYADILQRLGKHTAKGGCLHIKKLADVDQTVLAELLATSYAKK